MSIPSDCPLFLVEPFFGSNTNDCKAAGNLGITGMARMYLAGVKTFAGLEDVAAPEPELLTTSSGGFLVDVDIVHRGLTKKQFFARNRASIMAIVAAINKKLEAENHGEPINKLTLVDALAIMNAEMGLKAGKVDASHVHSMGEKGLLPLPSPLEYWNGPQSANLPGKLPANLTPERNVKEFLLYLGNLKNKDVGRSFRGGALYRDLFSQEGIADSPKKQMAILAAAVHCYFYAGNYDLQLPYSEISEKVIGAATDMQDLLDFLAELGYKHAAGDPGIIANRIGNLKEGMALA